MSVFFSDLDPDCPAYYGNRSACHMMLCQFSNALEDARTSVTLDTAFVKGYLRISKCCVTLGDTVNAGQAIEKARAVEPQNASVIAERHNIDTLIKFKTDALHAYDSKDFRKVSTADDVDWNRNSCLLRDLCRLCSASTAPSPSLRPAGS